MKLVGHGIFTTEIMVEPSPWGDIKNQSLAYKPYFFYICGKIR